MEPFGPWGPYGQEDITIVGVYSTQHGRVLNRTGLNYLQVNQEDQGVRADQQDQKFPKKEEKNKYRPKIFYILDWIKKCVSMKKAVLLSVQP